MLQTRINAGFTKHFCLFKLLGGEIYLAVSWYTLVHFIFRIHLISHFCVPHLKFLEPKWSHIFFHKYNRKIACNEESTIVKFITSYLFCSKEASYSCDPFLYNILFLYIYSYKRMAIVQLI